MILLRLFSPHYQSINQSSDGIRDYGNIGYVSPVGWVNPDTTGNYSRVTECEVGTVGGEKTQIHRFTDSQLVEGMVAEHLPRPVT